MTKRTQQPKAPARDAPQVPLPAKIATASQQQAESTKAHPHENLDRASRAAVAYMSAGVSPHAFIEAWSDWAQHLAQAPGRQLELAARAQENMTRLFGQSLLPNSDAEPAFVPKAYDHRFRNPGWEKPPFRNMQQGFLAVQDWWDYATDHIAPWKSVYKTQLFTDSDMTFVLTSGGHNRGIINEPKLARGHHRISRRAAGALYVGPEAWVAQNTPQPGSWWSAWKSWLEGKSSGVAPAPSISAPDKGLVPIVAAPGTYVYQT